MKNQILKVVAKICGKHSGNHAFWFSNSATSDRLVTLRRILIT